MKLRTKNKGMEGLTVTPDGRTLVGIMQSALTVPDYGTGSTGKTVKPANVAPVRIVTVDLRTKAIHEYLYLLTNPATTAGAVSEITALSSTRSSWSTSGTATRASPARRRSRTSTRST